MADIEERLKNWILEQGYPLEMFVAKAFREAGFRTTQSEYYEDPENGDNREIDVIACLQEDIGEFLVRVQICIECKSAKKHPWVAFTSRGTRLAAPAMIVQRPASTLGKAFLRKIAHDPECHKLEICRSKKRNAYSLTEAFTNGKDNAYASCLSVAKCAKSITTKENIYSKVSGPICSITIPLVLIDGKLFECHQDEIDLGVSALESSQLIWRNQSSNSGHSIINVITKLGLADFISNILEFSKYIFSQEQVFQELEKEYLANYPNRRKRHL